MVRSCQQPAPPPPAQHAFLLRRGEGVQGQGHLLGSVPIGNILLQPGEAGFAGTEDRRGAVVQSFHKGLWGARCYQSLPVSSSPSPRPSLRMRSPVQGQASALQRPRPPRPQVLH